MVKFLVKELGYAVRNQRGSHVILQHPHRNQLSVPLHATLDRGLLRAILRDAGIHREEFERRWK